MKTMSVEKNGYLNGLVSLSKQHKYKQQRRSLQRKSTAKELAQSKNSQKKKRQ